MPVSNNPAYGQTKIAEIVGEGMYVSIDENPAYGERKSREQLEQDNEYEKVCDLANPSSKEPVYDSCTETRNECVHMGPTGGH